VIDGLREPSMVEIGFSSVRKKAKGIAGMRIATVPSMAT